MKYKISLSSVVIPPETYPLIHKALDEGNIGQSEYILEFEERISNYVGSKYCIAVCNGTMADAVAIAAAKIIYNPKQVIVPALTFIAQPNSVLYNGLRVIFADIKEDWTMNLKSLGVLSDSLIFYTDIMGRIGNIEEDILPYGPVIEDACEAFGSIRNNKFAGTFGIMGTYSFFPSHTISTGEGGAIVTDDQQLALLCQSIRAHGALGRSPAERFKFPRFGFNAKISTLQAVVGISLMKHVDELVEKRRDIFNLMNKELQGFDEPPGEKIIAHGYPLFFKNLKRRDDALQSLLDDGIECRRFFSCIPTDEEPHKRDGYYPVARRIADTGLYVPCNQNMTKDDVFYLSEKISKLRGRVI